MLQVNEHNNKLNKIFRKKNKKLAITKKHRIKIKLIYNYMTQLFA